MRLQELDRLAVRPPREAVSTATSGASIYSAWLRGCLVGAGLALALSGVMSVLIRLVLSEYRTEAARSLSAALVAVAAILEGGIIGYCQWRVLRRVFPTMSSRMWVGATMVAAAVGCVIPWLPTSFATASSAAAKFGDVSMSLFAAARLSILTGVLIGIVWGVSQYVILHRHAHHASIWVLSSTAAWAIAFAAVYFAAFWPDRTAAPFVHVLLAADAGVLLGLALGLLNGRALLALRSRLLTPRAV